MYNDLNDLSHDSILNNLCSECTCTSDLAHILPVSFNSNNLLNSNTGFLLSNPGIKFTFRNFDIIDTNIIKSSDPNFSFGKIERKH